jgi:hypothetical protein
VAADEAPRGAGAPDGDAKTKVRRLLRLPPYLTLYRTLRLPYLAPWDWEAEREGVTTKLQLGVQPMLLTTHTSQSFPHFISQISGTQHKTSQTSQHTLVRSRPPLPARSWNACRVADQFSSICIHHRDTIRAACPAACEPQTAV